MDEREWLAQRFQEHRPRMRALAYRMLGSTSEADDAVQEAWIRLSRSNSDEIDNLQASLLSVVGRVALNMLRSRKRRRGEQIGAILERSPEAARQLASRGRRRIRSAHTTPHAEAAAHQQEEVVEAFLAAARDGDFEALLAVLDPDIVERVDTGSGTIVEVRGALNVARRAMAASQRDGLVGRRALINGAPGWVSVLDGELFAIGALTVHNGRITTMDILLDPARLARLDPTDFDSRLIVGSRIDQIA
jgi:DNA-directed RNA polymerase specialized sigma24 family protein